MGSIKPERLVVFRYREYLNHIKRGYTPRLIWRCNPIKLISCSGDNNFPILCEGDLRFSVNGKYKDDKKERLLMYISIENPIIDNRLVSDYTFAKRLSTFLKKVNVNDACSEEELEYLQSVSESLLEWQVLTVTDQQEIDYLERINEKYKKK